MSDELKPETTASETPAAVPEASPVEIASASKPETAAPTTGEETSPVAKAEETKNPAPAYIAKLIDCAELRPGMTVRVHEKIKDVSSKGEERERIQIFEGMILSLRGSGVSKTMTVRKVSKGFGVEKIYPVNSPVIDKIELVKTARVRRAKLWFVTDLKQRFRRRLKETWIKK